MNFKQWYLNEVGTGTNCVAVFARPIFGANLVKRTWPQIFGGRDEDGRDDNDDAPHKKINKLY
jgi:hypothetical protein